MIHRGYFGIGVYHPKREVNVGTLWRSAYQLGASFLFVIGPRYTSQSSDTVKAWRHIPLFHFADMDDFRRHVPYSCPTLAIEMGGHPLSNFVHPERCIYLLGAEDYGIPDDILRECQGRISLASIRQESYNVAVAGSIVMYDRMEKMDANNSLRAI